MQQTWVRVLPAVTHESLVGDIRRESSQNCSRAQIKSQFTRGQVQHLSLCNEECSTLKGLISPPLTNRLIASLTEPRAGSGVIRIDTLHFLISWPDVLQGD